jgi:hypothetical protein
MTDIITSWHPRLLIDWYFNQEEIWIDKDLNVHQIDDMPAEYLTNVVAFLERVAKEIYEHRLVEWDTETLFRPTEPAEWLNETPLYRKIKDLVREYSAVGKSIIDSTRHPSF